MDTIKHFKKAQSWEGNSVNSNQDQRNLKMPT